MLGISLSGMFMSRVTVGKWGKNLAVRFPSDIAKAVGLSHGERVEVEVHDREIIIRRAAPQFSLAELFKDKPSKQWREEYAGAFEWDGDVGREIVEE
jgi:antitoxin component of MazEF toxin-antitoxin module